MPQVEQEGSLPLTAWKEPSKRIPKTDHHIGSVQPQNYNVNSSKQANSAKVVKGGNKMGATNTIYTDKKEF